MDTADLDETGRPRYTAFWAFGRPGEKRAFEALIDFITERRARCPGLHVYHYNHYEPTSVDHLTELHGTRQEAVGALMGRFATREDEVDQLFRLGVFVDLYRVVRQGVSRVESSHSLALRDWLEDRRRGLAERTGELLPRPFFAAPAGAPEDPPPLSLPPTHRCCAASRSRRRNTSSRLGIRRLTRRPREAGRSGRWTMRPGRSS